jgi:hypothetical protein
MTAARNLGATDKTKSILIVLKEDRETLLGETSLSGCKVISSVDITNPGEVVNFEGLTTSDPQTSGVIYRWDFGDGSVASGQKPSHSYFAPGTYKVSLHVSNTRGDCTSCTTELDVKPRATFREVFSIFEDNSTGARGRCTSCHSGPLSASPNLEDPDIAYRSLLGADGQGTIVRCRGVEERRVVPGRADLSYLVKTLDTAPNSCDEMAPCCYLNDIEVNSIINWINEGALNN